MRWKFYTPGERPEEDAQRAGVISRIDAWWKAFEAKAESLDALFNGRSEWDLVAWMERELQTIDSRLMWEFGPGSSGGHRLVITPEANYQLRPLAEKIVARAPSLPAWTFFAHRWPESVEQMSATVKARTGVEPAFTGVALTPGQFNRVDLLFQFPQSFLTARHSIARGQAFLAALSLLGEELLVDWAGLLDVAAEVPEPLPAGAVRRAFIALAARQRSGIPAQPFLDRIDAAAWTEIDLKPKKQEDYFHRYDLGAAVTCAPDLWRNAHSNQLFWSGRFSRANETFCYLKLDRGRPLRRSAVGERIKNEDALNRTLRPQRLGCVIGGGSGRRYDYIDLALIDVPAAASVIRSVLQQSGLAKRRAWIQFFDNVLGAEWIGLWPDGPPPPMPAT